MVYCPYSMDQHHLPLSLCHRHPRRAAATHAQCSFPTCCCPSPITASLSNRDANHHHPLSVRCHAASLFLMAGLLLEHRCLPHHTATSPLPQTSPLLAHCRSCLPSPMPNAANYCTPLLSRPRVVAHPSQSRSTSLPDVFPVLIHH